jgi:hypothetical protein
MSEESSIPPPPDNITDYVTSETPVSKSEDGSYELISGSVYKLTLEYYEPGQYTNSKEYALREIYNSTRIMKRMSITGRMNILDFIDTVKEDNLYIYFIRKNTDLNDDIEKAFCNYYTNNRLKTYVDDIKFGFNGNKVALMGIPIQVLNGLNIYPVTPPPVTTSTPQPVATPPPQPVAASTPQPVTTSTPQPVATSTPQPKRGNVRNSLVKNAASDFMKFIKKTPAGGKKSIKRKKTKGNTRLRRRFSVRRKKHN